MNIDPLRPYADLLRWGAGLLVVALLVFAGYRWGSGSWKAKHAQLAAEHAASVQLHRAVLDGLAQAAADLAQRAADASQALEAARSENDERFKQEVARADRAERELAGALRRGDARLRPEWSCAAAGPGPGGAEAVAGGPDAAAQLRYAGAAAIVAGADRADAWIGWLQRELTGTRQAMVSAGCAVEAPR